MVALTESVPRKTGRGSRERRRSGKGGLELLDDAMSALRAAPAATFALYYIGAIPFVLAFLYFWAEMSQSPFAGDQLAGSALGLALLYFWMKFWQTLFARNIRATLAGHAMPRWTPRQHVRVFMLQIAVQSSGLFLIPLAAILLVPFGWVYAFYQNATVLADTEATPVSLGKAARKQARLWPGQNHMALALALGFGTLVLVNWGIIAFAVPYLLKTFFDIETIFTKSPLALLNTTFLSMIVALTYLCMDPIVKTMYALRCFHGESLESGADIRSGLSQVSEHAGKPERDAARRLVVTALAAWILACSHAAAVTPVEAAPVQIAIAAEAEQAQLPSADLDREIEGVLQGRKYVWRMPRKGKAGDEEPGVLVKFIKQVIDYIREPVGKAIRWIIDWLFRSDRMSSGGPASGLARLLSSQFLLYVLLAAALAVAAILLLRMRRSRSAAPVLATAAVALRPDIAAETTGAGDLPEDGWARLGRELLERGELRLAMRAFYFASLAHLAGRNLVGIARFKSNREYENELRRRGHAIPGLVAVFGENRVALERVWYGMHETNDELVRQFAANVERIKSAA